jgi:hypothetical protein
LKIEPKTRFGIWIDRLATKRMSQGDPDVDRSDRSATIEKKAA